MTYWGQAKRRRRNQFKMMTNVIFNSVYKSFYCRNKIKFYCQLSQKKIFKSSNRNPLWKFKPVTWIDDTHIMQQKVFDGKVPWSGLNTFKCLQFRALYFSGITLTVLHESGYSAFFVYLFIFPYIAFILTVFCFNTFVCCNFTRGMAQIKAWCCNTESVDVNRLHFVYTKKPFGVMLLRA